MRRARRGPRARLVALDPLGDRGDVVDGRAAAAADDRDAVLLDELAQDGRQLVGPLGEDRLAVAPLLGQAGVRDAVDGRRGELAEEADRVAHVVGAGGAVQADDVDLQRLQRGEHGGDVGAQQHLAAVGQQRDRGLDGEDPVLELEGLARAEDGGLDLQDVLGGLDDEQVGAAADQALGLLGEDLDQLGESDRAERRVIRGGQVAGRADRAGDEAILADGLAGDLGGLLVDLEGVLAQAPLLELEAGGLEGVGLDDLGAGAHHRLVQLLDDVGPVQDERLVALALQPAVVGLREVELLQRRAHRAVEDDDVVTGGGQEIAHDPEG